MGRPGHDRYLPEVERTVKQKTAGPEAVQDGDKPGISGG